MCRNFCFESVRAVEVYGIALRLLDEGSVGRRGRVVLYTELQDTFGSKRSHELIFVILVTVPSDDGKHMEHWRVPLSLLERSRTSSGVDGHCDQAVFR